MLELDYSELENESVKRPEVVKLTKKERECIADRLEVYDCVAECIDRDDWDEVRVVCSLLLSRIQGGSVWFDDELQRQILIESVAGSTWWAGEQAQAEYAATSRSYDAKVAAATRTVINVTRKISSLTGEEIEPVLW